MRVELEEGDRVRKGSVLVREGAEKAEFYVHQLQNYKLQATMEPAE